MERYIAMYDGGTTRDITPDVVRLRQSLALAVSALRAGEALPRECEETLSAVSIGRSFILTSESQT